MGTEINAIVRNLLNESNIHRDFKLDKEEYSIFKDKLANEVNKGTLTQEQVQVSLHEIVQKVGTEDVKSEYMLDQVKVTNPITQVREQKAPEYTKKDLTRAYKHIQNTLNSSIQKSSSIEEFINNIEKEVQYLAQDSRYSLPFIERIKHIKSTYLNSTTQFDVTSDIDAIHEEIVKAMAKDEFNGLKMNNAFDLDMLDALETVAKKEIFARTKAEVAGALDQKWNENLNKFENKVAVSDIVAQVEAQLSENGTRVLNVDQKEALKQIKNERAKEKAEAVVLNRLENLNINPELLENFKLKVHKMEYQSGKVQGATRHAINETKKDLKTQLKAEGLWDDYTKNVVKKLGFEDNIGYELELENIDRLRTAYTKEDILKKLNSKNKPLFEALEAKGLIKPIEGSDKYDITNLSVLIGEIAGAENVVNRTTGDFKTLSERRILLSYLKTQLKDNMKPADRENLVELCGYRYEKINWAKVLANGVTLGALDAAETGLLTLRNLVSQAVIAGGDILNIIGKVNITQYTNVNITLEDIEKLGLQELITVNSKNEVFVDFGKIHQVPEILYTLPKDIRPAIHAAYQASVIGALAGIVKGTQSVEPPVTPITFKCQTFEEYMDFINNHHKGNSELIKTLGLLASTFVDLETGVWDCEGYQDALKEIAGYGSVLNKDEIGRKTANIEPEQKPAITEPKEEIKNDFTPQVIELKAGKCDSEGCKTEDVVIKDATRSSWQEAIKQYGGCLEQTFGSEYNAIRVLKIAQAITDGDYSVERLQYLLDLSLKGSKYLRDIEGLDFDVYYDKLTATTMPKELKLPVRLGECDLLNEDLNRAKITNILKKGEEGYKEAGKPAIGTTPVSDSEYWTKLGSEDEIIHKNENAWNQYIKNYEEADDVIIRKEVPCEDR